MKLAALVLAAALLATGAEQGTRGTVAGTVKLTVTKSTPLATAPYARRGVAPKRTTGGPDTRNVVIYVTGLRPSTPPAPTRAKIAQKDEQFVPQVTAVTVGSIVDFPNDDPFFHNVFSLSKAATFDLGRYPSGSSRARQFPKPGIVKVFCDIHSHMTALIMVLDHPWFTIPAEDGTFTLPPLPAGDMTVVAWHERIGERRERVRVTPGQTTRVSFTLPVLEPGQ
jgi:plastocyanin